MMDRTLSLVSGLAREASEWEAVPEGLREHCKALGICTVWSALDWSRMMMLAVDAEVDRSLPRSLVHERAELKAKLIAFVGSLDLAKLDTLAAFAVQSGNGARAVVDVLSILLRDKWAAE